MNEYENVVFISNPLIIVLLICMLVFLAIKKFGYLLGLYSSSFYLFASVQLASFRLLHLIFISLLTGSIIFAFRKKIAPAYFFKNAANTYLLAFTLILIANFYLLSADTIEGWNKLKYYFFFTFFPVVVMQLNTSFTDMLNEFIISYVISCTVISIITILYIRVDSASRLFLINNPITFSIPLAISCIFLAYYMLYGKFMVYKAICLAGVLFLISFIIMSGTRQSLFCLIAAFVAFACLQRERKISKIHHLFLWGGLLIFLFLLPGITSSLGVYDRFITDILTPGKEISIRSFYWSRAFNDFLDSPLIGIGLGSFGEYQNVPGIGLIKDSEHNLILEILAESGLVGFCLFAGYFFICMRCAFRVLRYGSSEAKSLCTAFLCVVIFSFAQSMFSGGLIGSAHLFWSSSALVVIECVLENSASRLPLNAV